MRLTPCDGRIYWQKGINEDAVGTDDVFVSESVRERQEGLQVNTVVIMDELHNPDDQGLGRAIRPVADEKSLQELKM